MGRAHSAFGEGDPTTCTAVCSRVTREFYRQCTIFSTTDPQHNAPAHDPNLAQTAPQPPEGEKLYVPPAVKREEITETFLTLRGGGANMWIGAVNSHQSTSY